MNIREATEEWVNRDMNEIDAEMIRTLMEYEPEDWNNVTPPQIGNKVYVYVDKYWEGPGEISNIFTDEDGNTRYVIDKEDGKIAQCYEGDFETNRNNSLPMWGTLWSFKDYCDTSWLEDNLDTMAECGFTIIHSDKFGYFFGIDGAGYGFYDAHWIPLYKARGLRWHDED